MRVGEDFGRSSCATGMPRAPISKKRNPLPPLDRWLIVLYFVWLLVGAIVGIWVNDRYYAIERGEMNPPNSSQDGQDDLP
jgi:hypothetical protein